MSGDSNDRGRGPDFGESTIVQPQDIEEMLLELESFIRTHRQQGRDPITVCAALANSILIVWDQVPPATQMNIVQNLSGFLGALSQRLVEENGRTLKIRSH